MRNDSEVLQYVFDYCYGKFKKCDDHLAKEVYRDVFAEVLRYAAMNSIKIKLPGEEDEN